MQFTQAGRKPVAMKDVSVSARLHEQEGGSLPQRRARMGEARPVFSSGLVAQLVQRIRLSIGRAWVRVPSRPPKPVTDSHAAVAF